MFDSLLGKYESNRDLYTDLEKVLETILKEGKKEEYLGVLKLLLINPDMKKIEKELYLRIYSKSPQNIILIDSIQNQTIEEGKLNLLNLIY